MSSSAVKDNLSLVLKKIDEIVFESRVSPIAGPGEVIVNIKATGICGSDVHYWTHGRIGHFVVNEPMVLGHESAGLITAVGPNVTHLKVGDRVALEPGVPCRKCDMCRIGKYNLCPDMAFAATPPYDGTLCNYYKHAADFCYKLPDNISYEEGALIEPLSVGIHAIRRGNVKLGDRIFIFGAGAIGLLTAAVAKAAGASHVTIADRDQSRLEFAKSYIADEVIQLGDSPRQQDTNEFARIEATRLLANGTEPCNVVFDCTGAEVCVQMAVFLQIYLLEKLMSRVYPAAIEMLASKKIDLTKLITDRYPFRSAVQAFQHVKEGRKGTVKVIIHNV
ncbi:chaperonin 10-like protein [Pilobolus umbonatus]|nr:chaperonin 10-like protein [Pilobolus umbonatus]